MHKVSDNSAQAAQEHALIAKKHGLIVEKCGKILQKRNEQSLEECGHFLEEYGMLIMVSVVRMLGSPSWVLLNCTANICSRLNLE